MRYRIVQDGTGSHFIYVRKWWQPFWDYEHQYAQLKTALEHVERMKAEQRRTVVVEGTL
jgi:hypothetical protein